MARPAKAQVNNSSRALAQARRRALSSAGKTAAKSSTSPGMDKAQKALRSLAAEASPAASDARPATAGARAASLARRKALSTRGKTAMPGADRTRTVNSVVRKETVKHSAVDTTVQSGCGCGCNGTKDSCDAVQVANSTKNSQPAARVKLKRKTRVNIKSDSCRAAALARRKAHSSKGKAGVGKAGISSAQTARASNPGLSGRELAQALREQKSRRGNAGQRKSVPTGRIRPARKTDNGSAQDASWKVGASSTSLGQTVTGTMVGRSQSVTGDEASTCRDVTGTEYLGADIFKEFCQDEPAKAVQRGGVSKTFQGGIVTGSRVGRSQRVTGDEPGTCKNVTGTDYVDSRQSAAFCGSETKAGNPLITRTATTVKGKTVTGDNVGRSDRVTGDESGASKKLTGDQYTQPQEARAPAKVGSSKTLSGGSITGSRIGRSERVTGDEPGSCRNVTGDDYIGQEQFTSFCNSAPEKTERKSGVSKTINGETVTGTMTGRSGRVTGNEPGTCKAITGTPYAGSEQYQGYCETDETRHAGARMQKNKTFAGAMMTGIQPSVAGKMTGDSKGACETVSGTPYVGRDQIVDACPSIPAEPGSPDFPQSLEESIGADFSVLSPSREAQVEQNRFGSVTGSRYEQGSITGPFGMASGKVTGTEEARFDKPKAVEPTPVAVSQKAAETQASRITGEGMDAGSKITGDDWDRGDRVTGTEGASAIKRNPTIRGPVNAMSQVQTARNEELPEPVSRVTGGSGNTDRGALITYSGGARG